MKIHLQFKDPRLTRVFFPDACYYLRDVTGDPRYTHLILHFEIQSNRKPPAFIEACQSLYDETQNPLFAWKAIKRLHGKDLPEWCSDYLMQSSLELLNFDTVGAMNTTGGAHVHKAMGFSGKSRKDCFKPFKKYVKELACCILVFLAAPEADTITETKGGQDAVSLAEEMIGRKLRADTIRDYREAMSFLIEPRYSMFI